MFSVALFHSDRVFVGKSLSLELQEFRLLRKIVAGVKRRLPTRITLPGRSLHGEWCEDWLLVLAYG